MTEFSKDSERGMSSAQAKAKPIIAKDFWNNMNPETRRALFLGIRMRHLLPAKWDTPENSSTIPGKRFEELEFDVQMAFVGALRRNDVTRSYVFPKELFCVGIIRSIAGGA